MTASGSELVWDVALSGKAVGNVIVSIPTAIGRPLIERGYKRARLTVTEDGILLAPYKGGKAPASTAVDLPEWGKP